MARISIANGIDKTGFIRVADGLVIAIAVSLPWSTSATAILAVLWIFAVIPVVGWIDVRRELLTPAGGLPVVLVVLGLAGMLWADVTLFDRWKGFDSFLKLLVIPLLLAQFQRSDRGEWVFLGYLCSCVALLVATMIVMAVPPLSATLIHNDGVLVKNGATQSGEFVTCIFGMLYIVADSAERRRMAVSFGLIAIIVAMFANMVYVSTGRTALVTVPVLLALFAVKRLSGRGIVRASAAAVLVGIVAWSSSPYLRDRTVQMWTDVEKYQATSQRTSSGERIEFWKKSVDFIQQSPAIGHGTGSIRSLFEKAAAGKTGTAGVAAANPHNQTFAVAIQLGLIGVAILWAMWVAHLLLFRGNSLAEWIGLMIVVQNMIGSLFNSHLFDFVQGWVYVVGVGVAGGITLKNLRGKEQSLYKAKPATT